MRSSALAPGNACRRGQCLCIGTGRRDAVRRPQSCTWRGSGTLRISSAIPVLPATCETLPPGQPNRPDRTPADARPPSRGAAQPPVKLLFQTEWRLSCLRKARVESIVKGTTVKHKSFERVLFSTACAFILALSLIAACSLEGDASVGEVRSPTSTPAPSDPTPDQDATNGHSGSCSMFTACYSMSDCRRVGENTFVCNQECEVTLECADGETGNDEPPEVPNEPQQDGD